MTKTYAHGRVPASQLKRHMLRDVDLSARTAFCRKCDRIVAIWQDHKMWRCSTNPRPKVRQATADRVRHNLESRDESAMTGVCAKCGPTVIVRSGSTTFCEVVTNRARDRHLRERYGVTLGWYFQAYADQGGSCAICRTPKDLLHVDHNHETGRARGLLCGDCNRGIGLFHESPKALLAALEYLEMHS